MTEVKDLLQKIKWQTSEYVLDQLVNIYDNEKIKNFLKEILNYENNFRAERANYISLRISGFPSFKYFEKFDFNFQPNLNKGKIELLKDLSFIKEAKNVVFIGTPGTGKTHLSIALGIEAVKNKYSTYFIDCNKLLDDLQESKNKNMLEKRIKHYCRYKLLIIDEIGYLPMNEDAANIFFQLVNHKYQKSSIIITTNRDFGEWGKLFKDEMLANAILDRLLHKATIIPINGKSYRSYQTKLSIKEVK